MKTRTTDKITLDYRKVQWLPKGGAHYVNRGSQNIGMVWFDRETKWNAEDHAGNSWDMIDSKKAAVKLVVGNAK